jgi:hypothetical protein
MSSLHSWKKGNSDLTAQHYGIATAKYLAMTRQQVIDGAESEALQTLKSIWNYQTYFSPADKLSVVKIICHIVSDQELVDLNVTISDKVRKKFLDIAGTLAGQLKNDKVAQVQALSLIKKTTNTDVIAEDSINVQLRSIERAIKNLTVKLDREGVIAADLLPKS